MLTHPFLGAFFLSSAALAWSGVVPDEPHQCVTEVRRNSAGTFYLNCGILWHCPTGDCDVQDWFSTGVHHYYCGCGDGSEPNCNGWIKSRSADWSLGGFDVGCFDNINRCPDGQVCDEKQVPVPPEGGTYGPWIQLCVCSTY